jgi:hypothetical protein
VEIRFIRQPIWLITWHLSDQLKYRPCFIPYPHSLGYNTHYCARRIFLVCSTTASWLFIATCWTVIIWPNLGASHLRTFQSTLNSNLKKLMLHHISRTNIRTSDLRVCWQTCYQLSYSASLNLIIEIHQLIKGPLFRYYPARQKVIKLAIEVLYLIYYWFVYFYLKLSTRDQDDIKDNTFTFCITEFV